MAIDVVQELQEAIFKYMGSDVSDFKTICAGGFFYDEYKKNEETEYPHAIYFFLPFTFDRDSCSKHSEVIVQFDFKDNEKSSARINSVVAEFDERFDDCENSLIMTNFKVISVDRVSGRSPRKSIAKRWEASRDYKISIDRKT